MNVAYIVLIALATGANSMGKAVVFGLMYLGAPILAPAFIIACVVVISAMVRSTHASGRLVAMAAANIALPIYHLRMFF